MSRQRTLDQPSTLNHQPYLWRILAIIIGALFVYAGALKVWDPVGFAGDIQNYHVLPWTVNRAARLLPALAGNPLRARVDLSPLVFRCSHDPARPPLVFSCATIAAKARGIDISCGCFGHVSDQLSFAWHLVLDFAILAAVVALWVPGRTPPLPSQRERIEVRDCFGRRFSVASQIA